MAVFLVVVGRFISDRKPLNSRQIVILACLLLLAYFSHITAFAAAALVITMMTVFAFISSGNALPLRTRLRHFFPLLSLVPSTIIALVFLAGNRGGGANFSLDSLRLAAWRIYSIAPIASCSDGELLFGKAVAAIVGIVGIAAVYLKLRDGRLRFHDGLLAATVCLLVLTIIGPDTMGTDGVYIRMRLVFYFYFILILWMSSQVVPKALAAVTAVLAVLISGLLFVSRAPMYAELDRQIDEYLSADAYIDANTTLLSLSYASHGYHPTQERLVKTYLPFEHIAGLLAAEKPVVDLGNYEADTYSFWTTFRPSVNPYRFINNSKHSDSRPSETNLFGYPPESGGRIDYVLFWGLDKDGRRNNPPPRLRDQLNQAYDLIYTSPKRQLVQLYRRKGYVTE